MREDGEVCENLNDSMTGTKNTDQEVTTFANEACEAVQVLSRYQPSTLANAQNNIQDIKSYFGRPRLIQRGTIPFGSNAVITVPTFGANQATMINIFPQWRDRLAGAFGIRFKLNFALQVAATSFHQGLLAMSWQYGSTAGGPVYYRGQHHWTATHLPHVRMDLSETTMVELSIPFLYTGEFMETSLNATASPFNADYGRLTIIPLLQLIAVAGLAAPTYDLYCYLTDIELYGVDVVNPNTIAIQSDILTGEVKYNRVVSKTLSATAKISSFIAKGVPSLAALAGPAAWALDTAAGVARYFGYSKPMLQDPVVKHFKSDWASDHHVDVPMSGEVIGMFQGNSTTVSTAVGATDVDEMALSFVTKQWSQVMITGVTTSNTHGTAIYATPVSPAAFWFRKPTAIPYSNRIFPADSAGSVYSAIAPSNLMYISSFFRQWRGSVKFRITFAKTKLHGGRYMASFIPYHSYQVAHGNYGGNVLGPEVVASLQQPYGNSMIMDLKDGNVFEFTAPYELPNPYCNFVSASGGFTIVCIDPLQTTGTVTNAVPVMIEVCAGDDFELADYSGPYFTPHPTGIIQTQSGDLVKTTTKEPSALTMGEKVTSLKQIIMQPNYRDFSIAASAETTLRPAPWYTNVNYRTTLASPAVPCAADSRFEGSASSALAVCYAFVKGGTDVHIYPEVSSGLVLTAFQNAQEFTTLNSATASLLRRPFISSTPKALQYNSPLHARLPSFQTAVRIPPANYDTVYSGSFSTAFVGTDPYLSHSVTIVAKNTTTVPRRILCLRSAADDAMMAHYMGPPPIFIPNSASTLSLDLNSTGFT